MTISRDLIFVLLWSRFVLDFISSRMKGTVDNFYEWNIYKSVFARYRYNTGSSQACTSLTVYSIISATVTIRLHPVQVSMQRNGDKGEWVLAELSLVRLSSHLSCIHSSFDFFTECEQRVAKLGVLGKRFENHCKPCKYNIYKYIYISRTLPINWQTGLAVRVDNDMHCFSNTRYTTKASL